ncbi:hypothetical protein A8H35_19340 [Burkholderia thailandensis]|nr:hypothetical protein WJ27_25370 [Burkholderia thailandensis]AOJ54086.1 hypothetical protein AQ475_25180 [Burkholderia thailandensis]AVR08113.1 hypothetical protein A8H31_12190 [Burkholderia thailandensis]AVR27767.1 hypothetical protein A8H32_22485 [Burkholderia thailandensis]AWY60547.1 hypothetical protein A8H35_19340 [Burkholderia thailandensis]
MASYVAHPCGSDVAAQRIALRHGSMPCEVRRATLRRASRIRTNRANPRVAPRRSLQAAAQPLA